MTGGAIIPVTVIGGFLGSGKTTLVNRILGASRSRTAVLVNDFGEINVDAALIRSDDGLTMELSGGCICCSMAEGIGPAIFRAIESNPDEILIEASGVGEPRRVAEFALLDRRLKLDMVITLANAVELSAQLDDPLIGDTVARQFDGADLVVLNHVDAASPAQMATARAALRRIAPGRAIAETSRAELPLELLSATTLSILSAPQSAPIAHDEVFFRTRLETHHSFERTAFEAALNALPATLLRLKGWVAIDGEPTVMLLQYVAGRWELTASDDPGSGTRLVGIATAADLPLARLLGAETVAL
ncbi:GTP-binding protein [Pseudooceanicola sediminis]|uniref:GTP-binding protein n=1 Tax=Pseudooceanicola sediminis TaxID=2211117 RepID=A0A399JCR1_9RHOB|nr:CobW family GTP-binding protein [Pseudooceanicola sediminis]KAA2315378.1 GTP-binding protein [Puniceibacterium sp. HSS470]RII40416.1 GTP-binding protein [Pseudooceanicola sediminis]|tara:strand:- start:4918 stop:5826 length:909 start_codon:yes stop_codon:yes gene_type:complete